MRLPSLLYHDVAAAAAFDRTGFQGSGADVYKIEPEVFEGHLKGIADAGFAPPICATEWSRSPAEGGWALTVDDGGVTSASVIAPLLDELGWRAHFFVTTGHLGSPNFVSEAQLQDLHQTGHVIGSHTETHPSRLSALPYEDVLGEWRVSVERLTEVLGEPVRVGSVPGGYYSKKVVAAAVETGIEVLFNSEPVTRTRHVHGALVLGRFHVKSGTTDDEVAGLLRGRSPYRRRQWVGWTARQVAKRVGGGWYVQMRQLILSRRR